MNSKKKLFRQQAIDNITSPEKIGLYIKTSNPKTITLILATSFFIIGLFIWSIFYKIDTLIPVGAVCLNGSTECYLNETDFEKLKKTNPSNIQISINKTSYAINELNTTPQKINENSFSYAMHKSRIKPGDWAFKINLETKQLNNGTFTAWLTANKIAPISFIFN